MSTTPNAATVVDSATTPQVTQFNGWDEEGTPIVLDPPKTPDSATGKEKDKAAAAPDSAPDPKDKKPAVSASDSATDKEAQKPHLKTKEDTEKRFQELTDRLKKAEERAEAAERRTTQPEKRDDKQVSQPAPEKFQRLDDKKFFAENPKATYDDYLDAAIKHGADWQAKQVVQQALAAERQRMAMEAEAKSLTEKMAGVKTRYPDAEGKVIAATKAIVEDQQIPMAVKSLLNESDVLIDVLYMLGGEAGELQKFVELARTNPGAALRKIALTESLVKEQLSQAKPAAARGEDGKFQKADEQAGGKPEAEAETKPRAPKPPSEVGGRGTAPEDPRRAAAASGDFRQFEAEENRRLKARFKS